MSDKEKLALIKKVISGAYDVMTCDEHADFATMSTTMNVIEIIVSFGQEEHDGH